MIWLLGVLLILQTSFHWILEPAILMTTPIFELKGLGWLLLLIGGWLISGRTERQGPL